MDLDVDEGPFSSWFPLPYRVVGIITLGIWTWATAFRITHAIGIPNSRLLYGRRAHSTDEWLVYHPAHAIATIMTGYLAINLLLFWSFTIGDVAALNSFSFMPLSCFLLLILLIVWPRDVLYRAERYRFLRSLWRVLCGRLGDESRYHDIVLADLLTSFAKVAGDLFVMVCMAFSSRVSYLSKPDQAFGGSVMVPLIISAPYMIRLKQCISAYRAGGPRANLFNALKYSTAFPVIVLSALQRTYAVEEVHGSEGPALLRRQAAQPSSSMFTCWIISVLINSLYSFYWDVTNDWDLTLLTRPSQPGSRKLWGLRADLYIPRPALYYGVIAVNFCLRMTWSIKLSPHLHHLNDMEGGIFLLEVLEVFRRWVWIVFRTETEWVRTRHRRSSSPELIALADQGSPGAAV